MYRLDIRSESPLYTCSGCVQVARPRAYEPRPKDADNALSILGSAR